MKHRRSMTYKITLINVFSLILALGLICSVGCSITKIEGNSKVTSSKWLMPDSPKKYPVSFQQKDGGLFLSKEDSENLMLNIDELDTYILQLEALIKTMKKYHNEK